MRIGLLHSVNSSWEEDILKKRIEDDKDDFVLLSRKDLEKKKKLSLIISNSDILEDTKGIPFIGGKGFFAGTILKALGIDGAPKGEDFYIAKWFDGCGWSFQSMIILPLKGMMDGNIGAQETVGYGMRFIDERIPEFDSPRLISYLQKLHIAGFVTFSYNLIDGLSHIQVGLPGFSLANALEAIPGTLGKFYLKDKKDFQESWTISYLLSIFPYPLKKCSPYKVFLEDKILKHFIPLGAKREGNSFSFKKPEVGIATSWSLTMNDAARRVINTCKNITLSEKQFRFDLSQQLSHLWGMVRNDKGF